MHVPYVLATMLLCVQLNPSRGFSLVDNNGQRQGRKLFGGYRIVPKPCRSLDDVLPSGICMFNHECAQRQGDVIGACMDGFLFGACCKLSKDSIKMEELEELVLAQHIGHDDVSGSSVNRPRPPAEPDNYNELLEDPELHVANHPHADTILLTATSRPELSTYSYVTQNTEKSSASTSKLSNLYWVTSRYPTPATSSTQSQDNLVLVPTISVHEPNNNAESINHIINILNTTSADSDPEPEPIPSSTIKNSPGLSTWVSINGAHTSTWRPPMFNTKKPTANYYTNQPTAPNYNYHTNYHDKPISVTKPSKPQPAPTVIVLGPLTNDYSTSTATNTWPASSQKPWQQTYTKKPLQTTATNIYNPVTSTWIDKKPSTEYTTTYTTLVNNRPVITTVQTVQTSPTSTVPPSSSNANQQDDPATTELDNSQITTQSADLVNFPPVRNPSLNLSQPDSALETDFELSTPPFLEDDKLNDRLKVWVTKVVNSLQGEFLDLENVVLRPQSNYTTLTSITTTTSTTKKPTRGTTRRPSTTPSTTKKPRPTRPTPSTTRKPQPSRRPTTAQVRPQTTVGTSTYPTTPGRPVQTTRRPTTSASQADRPLSSTTKRPRPTTSKRPRPTKRSTSTTTEQVISQEDELQSLDTTQQTISNTGTTTSTTTTITSSTTTSGSPSPSSSSTAETDLTTTTTAKPIDYKHECGVRPLMSRNGRIVGGKGATFGEWPWQVLVRESTWLGLFTKNKCGGVLISNRYVMTAAHCQPGFLANLVVVLGEFDISGELESRRSVTRNVRRVIVHRNYDAATFANDLALLELESPVQFDAHIVPICLPADGEDFTGRMATVSGWGRLKYGGGVPSVLQAVTVPVLDNSACQEMFHTAGHAKLVLAGFLCAGYVTGQKDSCEGDSGGPLMLERDDGRWELVGTVSHGIKCAAPYLPGVYMRTTYYKPWLRSITGIQ